MFDAEAELAQELLELACTGSEAGSEADAGTQSAGDTAGSPEGLVAARASSFLQLQTALQLRSARFQALTDLLSSESAVGPGGGLKAWPRGSSSFLPLGTVQGGASSALPDCLAEESPCDAPQRVDLATAQPPAARHAEQSQHVPSFYACSASEQVPRAAQAPSRPHTPDLASERHGCFLPNGAGRSSPAASASALPLGCVTAPAISTAACQKSFGVLGTVELQHDAPPPTSLLLEAEHCAERPLLPDSATAAMKHDNAPDASLASHSSNNGEHTVIAAAVPASQQEGVHEQPCCETYCAAAATDVVCRQQPPSWDGAVTVVAPSLAEVAAHPRRQGTSLDAWQQGAAAASVHSDATAATQALPHAKSTPLELSHAEAPADAERWAAAAAEVQRLAAAATATEAARERSAAALSALQAVHAARRRAAGAICAKHADLSNLLIELMP